MTLINCRACGREVSAAARSCPHCGDPRPADESGAAAGAASSGERHELVTLLLALLFAGVTISIIAAVWPQ